MATTAPVTADELLRMDQDSTRYELILGELLMMSPAGWRHGQLVFRLSMLIGRHVEKHNLGRCFGAETGFLLSTDPDTVLAPDIAFIAAQNLPAIEPEQAYWPGAPDLIVEVRSPQDSDAKVADKNQRWLAAGGQMVWDVDPAQQQITVHCANTPPNVIANTGTLYGDDLLPGFALHVADVFTE